MSFGSTGAVHFPVNTNAETPGVFLQRDRPKNVQKKVDYKTRKLRHPLRHVNEQEALIQMEVAQEEDKKKFNKNNKNFIHRNKERFKSKDQVQHAPSGSTQIKPGTVTLTQEQLAALLSSLGKIANKDNPMKISIDASNNRIEVENYESNDSGENEEIRKHRNITLSHSSADGKHDKSDTGTSVLQNKFSESGKSKHLKTSDSDKRNSKDKASKTISGGKLKSEAEHTLQSQLSWEVTRQEDEVGDIPNIVPWKHMTVGERKRLQWAREREELPEDYDPWGKPGAGAPRHKKEEETDARNSGESVEKNILLQKMSTKDAERRQKQKLIANEIERIEKEIRETEKSKLEEEERALKESRQNEEEELLIETKDDRKNKTQKVVEAPVKADIKTRSNQQDDDKDNMGLDSAASLNKKEIERLKWLAELDKQRQELRLRKQQEKEREREGIHDQFVDRFVDRFVNRKTRKHISSKQEQYITRITSENTDDVGSVLGKLPELFTEASVPHTAMRSAMVIGTGTLDETRYDNVRSEEKRRWLEELDRQREEQHKAKLVQKEKDREDAGIWADQYPADRQKLRLTNEILQNQSLSPRPSNSESTQRTNSAPNVTTQDSEKNELTPPTFLRGQGAFIDPVTRKEHEEKRRIQLEYQAQVKAQIEEKDRKKREDRERKMREDMEEERKLQMERDSLNLQLELEQRKNREREELRRKQMVALKSALDEAQEKALEDKNVKRIHHLQKRGHDVSQLRAAYEVNAPLLKEYDNCSVNERGMESSREYQTYKTMPALTSTYNIDTDLLRHEPLGELGSTRASYKKDPYIENRVLTPSSYRNPSKSQDMPDSPRREFGTQTLELKDLKAILQNLPNELQIEYKMKVEEALQEKEKRKQAPTRKVHAKHTEENVKDTNVSVREEQTKEKSVMLEKRPLWNQRKRKTVKKNSEKDPFYLQKKEEAEQRRDRREKQLFYLQELNKERIPSHSKSPGKSPGESPEENKEVRGRKVAAASNTHRRKLKKDNARDSSPNILSLIDDDEKKQTPKATQSIGSSSPPIPAIRHRTTTRNESDPYKFANSYLLLNQADSKYGDAAVVPIGDEFVPFMRTTEILDPSKADEPVAISRENSRAERARNSYYETHNPANKGKKLDTYRDREREAALKASQNPLFYPGLVSDHPTARQEMILQQLSSLKQNLKQRQKELEDYMTPGELQEGTVRY